MNIMIISYVLELLQSEPFHCMVGLLKLSSSCSSIMLTCVSFLLTPSTWIWIATSILYVKENCGNNNFTCVLQVVEQPLSAR